MNRIGHAAAAAAVLATTFATGALASSHREAPFITKLNKVDGTDFYMFRSYETGRAAYTTLIANYVPLQAPYGGPNFFTLDPDGLYEIHVDNTGDAVEDLTFQFRFKQELAGGPNGITLDIGGKQQSVPLALSGPIFQNLDSSFNEDGRNVRETFTVKVVRGDRRTGTVSDVTNAAGGATTFSKPMDNTGTAGVTNYAVYAGKHIYGINVPGCDAPGKLFVGQRQEGFAVNLGPVFDLINAPVEVITNDAARDSVVNPLKNFNVTSIALELPTSCLVSASDKPVIGGWTTASIRQARVVNPKATYVRPSREGGAWTQVSRLGHPLVNEVVIGIKDKDRFNGSHPKDDAQFADYVTHPTLPRIIQLLHGLTPPSLPRNDLVQVFLTGIPNVNANGSTAEMLRLNTALGRSAADTTPTPHGSQQNLGAALCFVNGALTLGNSGCDPSGFPNGRRPGDDVTDIALAVMIGHLYDNDTDAPSRGMALHDAVLQDEVATTAGGDEPFLEAFPYLRTPLPGARGDGS